MKRTILFVPSRSILKKIGFANSLVRPRKTTDWSWQQISIEEIKGAYRDTLYTLKKRRKGWKDDIRKSNNETWNRREEIGVVENRNKRKDERNLEDQTLILQN